MSEQQKNQTVTQNQEDKRVCPLLTMQITVGKTTMISGKPMTVPEQQLRLNVCIKENCAMFKQDEKKCGLIK